MRSLISVKSFEPLNIVWNEGWIWPAAEVKKGNRANVHTSHSQKNAPISPAGWSNCNASAIERWKGDEMKYSPLRIHTFLFHKIKGDEVKKKSGISD